MADGPEEVLPGFVERIARAGDTVRRPCDVWTPTVAALLDHYERRGFNLCPRHLGYDSAGREVLSYLPGTTVNERTIDPGVLGRAVRELHDAGQGFRPHHTAVWQWTTGPAKQGQVYCHNDLGPWNVIGTDDRIAGFIDFDTAGPADPVWELADLAYRYAPLYSSAFLAAYDWHPTIGERADRLIAILRGYEWPAHRYSELGAALVPNLRRHVERLAARAASSDQATARVAAEGARVDEASRAWLQEHATALTNRLANAAPQP